MSNKIARLNDKVGQARLNDKVGQARLNDKVGQARLTGPVGQGGKLRIFAVYESNRLSQV